MVAARLTLDTRGVEGGDVGGRRAYLLDKVFLTPPEGAVQTSSGCSVEGCAVATRGGTDKLGDTLGRIADLVFGVDVTPAMRAQRLANAVRNFGTSRFEPGAAISRNTEAVLFGHAHRYGEPPPADEPPTLERLEAIRAKAFVPRAATLVVVGDATLDAVKQEADRMFGGWRDTGAPALEAEPPPATAAGPRIVAFHTKGTRQILGAVAARGPAPLDGDSAAFEVATELLGAPQTSMAFRHVREEMGAAYDVGAGVRFYTDASAFLARGSFDRDRAIDGVQGLLDAIRELRDADVAADALDRAKRARIAAWRRTMETDEGIAGVLAGGVLIGLTPAQLQRRPERVAAVTAADVRAAARRYLGVGALHVVLAGDPDFLVTAQALRFGVPVRVDGLGHEM
jgi:zinc protease